MISVLHCSILIGMMKSITEFVCVYLLLLCAFLLWLTGEAKAQENIFIQTDELSVQYKRFHESARHPLFVDSIPKEGIDLVMNTDLLFQTMFWDNRVHTMTNDAQFKLVGWEFKLGTRITHFLTAEYQHHSQHLLDSVYPNMKFPVEDSLGFTLTIYSERPRGTSLLGF